MLNAWPHVVWELILVSNRYQRTSDLPLHNPDLLFCQPTKLVDQGVYLPVGGLDLALKECLLVTIFGCMVQGIDLYKQTH